MAALGRNGKKSAAACGGPIEVDHSHRFAVLKGQSSIKATSQSLHRIIVRVGSDKEPGVAQAKGIADQPLEQATANAPML